MEMTSTAATISLSQNNTPTEPDLGNAGVSAVKPTSTLKQELTVDESLTAGRHILDMDCFFSGIGFSKQGVLHQAVRCNQIEFIKFLIKCKDIKVNINLLDGSGKTALFLASSYGFEPIVDLLIKAGAEINIKDRGGISPLYAAICKGRLSIVELLTKAESSNNGEIYKNAYLLHTSARATCPSSVEIL